MFWDAVLFGLGCAVLLLLYFVPGIVFNLKRFEEEGYEGHRWSRIVYEVRRSGSFVYSGNSYRILDTRNPSVTAAELLQEFFVRMDTPNRERSLFSCVCRLKEEKEWQGEARSR